MTQQVHSTPHKVKRLAASYNMAVNLFWTIICLTPLCWFWFAYYNAGWFYTSLIISFLVIFLPNSFFRYIQIGKTSSVYKKIGVPLIQKFTQDGVYINRILRKKDPAYRVISNRKSIPRFLLRMRVFEKFHFMLFVFFLLSTVYAWQVPRAWWVFILTATNIIYNVYPIFLQQYHRLRLQKPGL